MDKCKSCKKEVEFKETKCGQFDIILCPKCLGIQDYIKNVKILEGLDNVTKIINKDNAEEIVSSTKTKKVKKQPEVKQLTIFQYD